MNIRLTIAIMGISALCLFSQTHFGVTGQLAGQLPVQAAEKDQINYLDTKIQIEADVPQEVDPDAAPRRVDIPVDVTVERKNVDENDMKTIKKEIEIKSPVERKGSKEITVKPVIKKVRTSAPTKIPTQMARSSSWGLQVPSVLIIAIALVVALSIAIESIIL